TIDELKTNLSETTGDQNLFIYIMDDIVLDDTINVNNWTCFQVNKTVTINLNGKTFNFNNITSINRFQIIHGGNLKIIDSSGKTGQIISKSTDVMFNLDNGSLNLESGTFNSTGGNGIQIMGSKDNVADYSKFTLGKDATLIAKDWAVGMFNHNYSPNKDKGEGFGIVVDIYGTIQFDNGAGISINGNLHPSDENLTSPNLPQIHIHNGAVINTPNSCAVYGAGYGNWIFDEGCTVNGDQVLSIKSGNWIINGGTFTCNGKYYDPAVAWSSGTEPSGAAVSITHGGTSATTYANNVSLIISGGTFISEHQSALFEGKNNASSSTSALSEKGITINGGEFITKNTTLYPIHILNLKKKPVSVTLNGQTPFYPGLNTTSAYWVNDTDNNWNVTLNGNIENVESIDLRHVQSDKIVTLNKNNHNFVKVVNDDKYLFEGWSNDTSKLGSDTKVFYGGVEYKPIFSYIKQYDTGEEVEDDEPTPTIEPTPIVTPTPTQNQTAKPTVKPIPEPKTVVIVENEVKFEDNKVITSITVPEGSSGSITFTQTEEKGMDEWIPESIEDTYSFDLSCDGEINGDSEIHFVMSDAILKSLGLTPDDVCLKHFEDGVWVKLKISYIILDDGTYYYTAVTKSFSPFEISFDAKSEEPTVTPTEPTQPQSPMPVLGLLIGLGAALLFRRK
ncbi:MAG TPA: PGF-pre-PGF domain-containing protein, partial [Methanocorpusculum sp.]|nr:PGF-pre-PGF domain-containing protein [Methanocorpusculum sp.]